MAEAKEPEVQVTASTTERKLKPNFYKIEINMTDWAVPERYQDLSPLGTGAFGTVCSALDTETDIRVAVKQLARPFQSVVHAKRCYRELKLLKHMNHDNVIGLLDVFTPTEGYDNFSDVYLVTELMGSDLHKIVRTQPLTDEHAKFFIYQIIRGLKYVHSAGIIHRDLKPSNVGVSEDCEIKILDFGLARATAEVMTGYVTTRYWRAPEIMFNWMHYNQKVDIWSVGCIMAELLTGQVLFPGGDYRNHLTRILQICGTPDAEFMKKIESETTQMFLASLPHYRGKDFRSFFLGANPEAIDLLTQLLTMDPDRRPSAEEVLQHPYLAKYHFAEDEPVCDRKYDDSFEQLSLDVEGWRKLAYEEINTFTPPPRQDSMES